MSAEDRGARAVAPDPLPGEGTSMTLPQGDLGLLETDVARRLLASALPARLAYTGRDGGPRVVPIWFQWTGDELVMGSLPGAAKVPALRARPEVAITIDTESFPPDVLLVRGPATIADVEGVVPEYAQAAPRARGGWGGGGAGAPPGAPPLPRRGAGRRVPRAARSPGRAHVSHRGPAGL